MQRNKDKKGGRRGGKEKEREKGNKKEEVGQKERREKPICV